MSFYKLEKASVKEANEIISKLDQKDKEDYLLKAAQTPYITNEIFSLLVKCFKDQKHTLAEAFSIIATTMDSTTEVNTKLNILLATGTDFTQTASQSLINGAYKLNAKTAAWLIENGADSCFGNNSALRNAVAENNTPVINELLKHGNNAEVYNKLLSCETETLNPTFVMNENHAVLPLKR